MSQNAKLWRAKAVKQDEFYTRREDIDQELKHYKSHFKGKVVYCNCDDPYKSKFTEYFIDNFHDLELKRLISTGYKERKPYFDDPDNVGLIYDGKSHNFTLKSNGDFRSRECINLLKQADIVVTNPPFSLFREYIAQLVEYDKKLLIIGNVDALKYQEIFPLIKNRKMGTGVSRKGMEFYVPENYIGKIKRIDEQGNKIVSTHAVWFTNLEYFKRRNNLILTERYTPEKYPKYDNYDAINVDKIRDIPMDYAGAMGVPITFIDKHNPDQFEILGMTDRANTSGLRTKKYTISDAPNYNDLNACCNLKTGNTYKIKYARILIRNRKPTSS